MKINSKLKNGKISFSKGKGTFTIKIGEVFKSDKSKQSSLKEWFEKLNNIFLFTISSFLIVGCGTDNVLNIDTTESEPTPFRLYMEYEQDENGFYHKTYPRGNASSYGRVYCETLPTQRVFWSSPNSFNTYQQQQWFSTPIIQYSTYTSNDGTTQQLYYLYEQFIGDTLTLVGGLSEETWDYVQVIID